MNTHLAIRYSLQNCYSKENCKIKHLFKKKTIDKINMGALIDWNELVIKNGVVVGFRGNTLLSGPRAHKQIPPGTETFFFWAPGFS